jgi:hypothetical protein
VHRATDSEGNPIPEETYTDSLFFNASHADAAKAGIIRLQGDLISYKRISL